MNNNSSFKIIITVAISLVVLIVSALGLSGWVISQGQSVVPISPMNISDFNSARAALSQAEAIKQQSLLAMEQAKVDAIRAQGDADKSRYEAQAKQEESLTERLRVEGENNFRISVVTVFGLLFAVIGFLVGGPKFMQARSENAERMARAKVITDNWHTLPPAVQAHVLGAGHLPGSSLPGTPKPATESLSQRVIPTLPTSVRPPTVQQPPPSRPPNPVPLNKYTSPASQRAAQRMMFDDEDMIIPDNRQRPNVPK